MLDNDEWSQLHYPPSRVSCSAAFVAVAVAGVWREDVDLRGGGQHGLAAGRGEVDAGQLVASDQHSPVLVHGQAGGELQRRVWRLNSVKRLSYE